MFMIYLPGRICSSVNQVLLQWHPVNIFPLIFFLKKSPPRYSPTALAPIAIRLQLQLKAITKPFEFKTPSNPRFREWKLHTRIQRPTFPLPHSSPHFEIPSADVTYFSYKSIFSFSPLSQLEISRYSNLYIAGEEAGLRKLV